MPNLTCYSIAENPFWKSTNMSSYSLHVLYKSLYIYCVLFFTCSFQISQMINYLQCIKQSFSFFRDFRNEWKFELHNSHWIPLNFLLYGYIIKIKFYKLISKPHLYSTVLVQDTVDLIYSNVYVKWQRINPLKNY